MSVFDESLMEIKQSLRLQDTTDHDSHISWLIEEGVRQIDSVETFDDCDYVFDITTNTVKLPKGFKQWMGLRFIELTNQEEDETRITVPRLFNQVIYMDFRFMNSCNISSQDLQANGALPYTTVCKINKGYIIFNTDVASLYSRAQLSYKGLAKDDDGRNLFVDDYKRAIRYYVCAEFSESYPDRYDKEYIRTMNTKWRAQKAWLKGEATKESFTRNYWTVGNIMRKILVNTI